MKLNFGKIVRTTGKCRSTNQHVNIHGMQKYGVWGLVTAREQIR
jgi:hypothetical protein